MNEPESSGRNGRVAHGGHEVGEAPEASGALPAPTGEQDELRQGHPLGHPLDAAEMESLLHDVPLELTVELGRVRMTLGELAVRLGPGSIIALDKAAGAPLEVRVQSRLIARAEAVAIGERCGIRILELVGSKRS